MLFKCLSKSFHFMWMMLKALKEQSFSFAKSFENTLNSKINNWVVEIELYQT